MTPEEETFITLQEPAPKISPHGTKLWHNENGDLHRENDLPAIIFESNTKVWYKEGLRHREHGPAVVYFDGEEEYWENGIQIK